MRSLKYLSLAAAFALAAAALAAGAVAAPHHGRHGHHGHGPRKPGHPSSPFVHHEHGKKSLCGLDVYWLRSSIQGDVFEIQGGQLALQKSSDAAVRTLAQRLISDHTQSLHDALQLAAKYHIDVRQEPTQTQQWQLEELSEQTGATFDHDYAQLEVADHQQDIEDAQSEVQMGCNRDIRKDAAQEIPTLQQHLQLSQQALSTTSED